MKTILVVDDDESIRDVLSVALTRAGHRVLQAGGLAAALGMTAAFRPDLVILDASLPDGDGMLVCSALREHPRTADTPVMMISGALEEAPKGGRGPDRFLAKPFRLEELRSRVAELLA